MSVLNPKGVAVAAAAALVTAGLTILPLGAAQADPGDEVVFNDANLRTCVEGAVGHSLVTEADALNVTDLLCNARNIADLTGLEKFANLEELRLNGNQISDIRPLAGLVQLKNLDLGNNQISDVSPLVGLTGLTILRLDGNQISDISPLAGLDQLTELQLNNNQILDLTALKDLGDLVGLDASAQSPPGTTAFLDVPATLPSILDWTGTPVAPAITPLGGGSFTANPDGTYTFDTIGDFRVSWSHTGSFSFFFSGSFTVTVTEATVYIPDPNLLACVNLELGPTRPPGQAVTVSEAQTLPVLNCSYENVVDLTGLEEFTGLDLLYLGNNLISDITPLTGLTGLTGLDLWENQISDLTPLTGLTGLTGLHLWENQVSDLTPLAGLTALTVLALGDNQISAITPLAGLTGLTHLYLENNQVDNLSPLAGLPALETLDLTGNQVSDVSDLAGLDTLTSLKLDDNQITSVASLNGLNNLVNFSIDRNQVLDVSALAGRVSAAASPFSAIDQSPPGLNALVGVPVTLPPVINWDGTLITPTITGPGSYGHDGAGNYTFDANGAYTVTWNVGTAATAFTGSFTVTVATALVIPDGALFTCVDLALPGPPGMRTVITDTEAESLTSLDCSSLGITDLTGLEAFVNLQILRLSDNLITDVGPLTGLASLQELYLDINEIQDLPDMSAMTGLTVLNLDSNQVTDLSTAGLTGSVYSALDETPPGYSALSGIPLGLPAIVDWDGSPVGLVFAPAGVVDNLDGTYSFPATGSYTASWAASGAAAFGGSFVVTVASIVAIPDGALFDCVDLALPGPTGARTFITDVEAQSLASLSCVSMGITDLTGLEAFINLIDLDLGVNQITDLGPLTGLIGLEWLGLYQNQVSDVTALAGLIGLEWLYLDTNQITDVGPLAGLMSLSIIDLTGNQITDVSPLAGLTGSTLFYLAQNKITDLSPMAGLATLIAQAHDQSPPDLTAQVGKPVSLHTITHHDGTEITVSITPADYKVASKPAATTGLPVATAAMPNARVIFNAPGVYTVTWSQQVVGGAQAVFTGQYLVVVTAGPPPPPPPPPPVPNPPPPNRVGAQGGTGAHPWTGTDSRPMVALALALLVTGAALRVSRRSRYQPAHRAT